MKLRQRLTLTAIAVTLPMIAVLLWFDAVEQHRAAEQRLTAFVAGRMPALRDRCEASPATFGGVLPPGPGPGPRPPEGGPMPPMPPPPLRARPAEAFAYGEDLRAQNPAAPVLSDALKSAIAGRDAAVPRFAWRSSEVEVLLRMSWGTGPCAFVLARGTTDPSWGSILPETQLWVLPMLIVLAAVLLAMGPIVGRIRGLTEAVRRSAKAAYARDIPMDAIDGGDEIGELGRAFAAAAREIRAQLHEKEQREQALRHFLANTTHDVMIPLTVLQGHLATLRERAAEDRPVDVAVVISAMDEAHYMASLMHNLAAIARLEAAEVELSRSPIDLNEVVQRVALRHRPIARELEVAIESAVPETPTLVSADVTLIEQAVSNVTYNAVRYNRRGGHVAVVLEQVAGEFCLRVIDDGPGVPAAELATLGTRGARGEEARTRAPDGQGLGLHIARRAAELHGFRLSFAASEYGGLEVKIEGERSR